MIVLTAKENLGQYFKLFKKTNTSSIKKVKSLLEQLRTWARNFRMKTKQAKSFRDYYRVEQVRFFEELFDETHEKVVAYNVILALLRIGVVKFEGNTISHNAVLANETFTKMYQQN